MLPSTKSAPEIVRIFDAGFQAIRPTIAFCAFRTVQSYAVAGTRLTVPTLRFMTPSLSNPPGKLPVVQAFNGPGCEFAYH
jgi:hypothetical protein